jgi:hypothetical protein
VPFILFLLFDFKLIGIRRDLLMKIKRLFMAAVFGCALFFSCDNADDENSLRWRTAIDIPVNQSFQVPPITDKIIALSNLGMEFVLLDLGWDDLPIGSGLIDFLNKFTHHEAGYHLSVTNGTGVNFTLYALLFRGEDYTAKTMPITEFSDLLTGTPPESLAAEGRVSLLGQDGLIAPAGGIGNHPMPDNLSDTLCGLILGSESLMWRWFAHVEPSDTGNLKTEATEVDLIHARLRLRISVENGFNSLLTM